MKKLKNIILIGFFSVMLAFTGIFLTACNEKGPEIVVTPSVETVELKVGQEEVVNFKVENYKNDGSVVLSVFDGSFSSSSKQSGHISFEANYLGSGVTQVVVSGVSGGISTLVATSNEGSKVANIVVKVNEYSTSLEAKDERLFLTKQSNFVPKSDQFSFSNNATIKDLKFYYIIDKNLISGGELSTSGNINEDGEFTFEQSNSTDVLKTKEFVYARLDDENNEIIFTQAVLDADKNPQTFSVRTYDTEKIYFIAEYENLSSGDSYYAISSFTTFLGIDTESFKIQKNNEEKTESTLITYNSASLSRDDFVVEVPYYIDSDNLEFDFEISDADLRKISLSRTGFETDFTNNKRKYSFEVVSRIAYKTTAKINFKLYYKGYKDVEDDLISTTKTLDVIILVAPSEIRVNDLKADDEKNNYIFYNSNIGDYGWQEFNIAVYAEDSSYTGAIIDFTSSQIEVKSGTENLWPGRMIVDFSEPLMIRGSGSATASEGNLEITLVSPVFEAATSIDPIKYIVNFEVKEGAKELNFTEWNFEYSQNNPGNGIYLSTSVESEIFEGIYADKDFSYANIIYQTDDRFADISYVGKEEKSGKYFLKLSVIPRQVGMQTVNVVLDNGRSILATFRIVDTFDNVTLNQNKINADNNGTISVSRHEKNAAGDDVGLDIIIRNSYEVEDQYDRACSILISSNNGTDVISSISYRFISNEGVVNVIEGKKGYYSLRTLIYGECSIEFTAVGQIVDDFSLKTTDKKVIVNLISYNPISAIEITEENGTKMTSAMLYVAENKAAVEPTIIKIQAKGKDPYSFYCEHLDTDNNVIKEYRQDHFNQEYVTFTATEDIFDALNNTKVKGQVMYCGREYGKIYNIGNVVLFDTKTGALTALKSGANVTIFANVRQYEWSMSYALNIKTYEYKTVTSITTNLKVENQEILFKQSEATKSFIVNVSPKNATNLKIRVIDYEINPDVRIIENPIISEINDGAYLVTLRMNSAVLDVTEKVGCTLIIAAEDWLSSDNAVLALYESKVLRYEVKYQNGTKENPFVLSSAEDVLEIGKSESGLNAYYTISGYIDMSRYADRLPLGNDDSYEFKGTIIGSNNATIAGLNISNGKKYNKFLYYGLFAELGESAYIENVSFEGSYNVEINNSADAAYIGIVAGINNSKNKIDANNILTIAGLNNVSVVLESSKIKIRTKITTYIGGVVGINKGEITKNYNSSNENVLVENKPSASKAVAMFISNQVLDIDSQNSDAIIYCGGMAGFNEGIIADLGQKSEYGYAGYMAYSLLSFNSSSVYEAFLGAVTGQNASNGEIYGGIVGGKVETTNEKTYVGGIAGIQKGKIGLNHSIENKEIVVRTFVTGYKVGIITASRDSNSGTKNIKVQATDDGESINEDASMIVRYYNIGNAVEFNDENAISYALVNEDNYNEESVSVKTYVSRTFVRNSFVSSTNEYLGDFLNLDISHTKIIKYQKTFEKALVVDTVNIEAKEGFIEFEPTTTGHDEKMFTVYYFGVEEYIGEDGNFTSAEISDIQKIVDKKLNTISINGSLFPFELGGSNLIITSESEILKIDSHQNLIIKGTGVAKLTISNILDARLSQVIYLNIINYFNYKSIHNSQSFFKFGDIRLSSGDSTISIYSNSNTIIDIIPIYETLKSDYGGILVTEEGEMNIDNKVIKLVKDSSFITTEVENVTGSFDEHTDYVISNNMIIFAKKTGVVVPKDTIDKIKLNVSSSVRVDGITFKYVEEQNPTISFVYFEGVTSVLSNYDTYTTSTSGRIVDKVTIVSDDENESLNYIIKKDGYIVQTKDEIGLFNISITGNYNIEISVNKRSSQYQDRFTNNIFGKYVIKYFGNSNSDQIYKEVVLTLSDEFLDNIVIDNYASENDFTRSSKVIPGQYGLLSVNISPADVDFTSFELANSDSNYSSGSSDANFEVGYLVTSAGSVRFVGIDGVVYSSRGVSVSKNTLISKVPNYDGQFYIRYIFENSSSVKDSAPVSFNIYLQNGNETLYNDVLRYTIYKAYVFNITIENKEYVEESSRLYHVARGVTYKLNIENTGYNINSINVTTSDSSLASLTKQNDEYYLTVTQRVLDYTRESTSVNIEAVATRVNAKGEVTPTSSDFNCAIMEYVINYVPTQEDKKYDIVKGMNNGNIVVALGTQNKLSIDFGRSKYLEYNENISSVIDEISRLMENATNNGIWQVYSDLESSIELPDEIGRGNDPTSIYTKDSIKDAVQLENKYFRFNGLEYVTNSEHNPSKFKHYIFTYEALFKANPSTGTYSITTEGLNHREGSGYLYSEFSMISYIRGSEKAPNPIRDYNGLKSMSYGGHYILTNDIHITPETFEPINVSFATLDGNGYSIIFDAGDYDISNLSDVGIFRELSNVSTIKNLNVYIDGDERHVVKFITTSTSSTIIGIIAAKNSGNITNARIYGNLVEASYNSSSTPSVGSYIAGIVATNSGNITNSQVTVSITTNVSVAGLVGINNGTIASSYYKGGFLTNTSDVNTKFYTAGLVINNSENGKIITSYSSGDVDSNYVYSYKTYVSKIVSKVQTAGAVYSNYGIIEDSYSNIPIDSTSSCAGFIYENAGSIERCFTTSIIIHDHNQRNYYFVAFTNITGENGTCENCFYLKDSEAKYKISEDSVEHVGINQSLASDVVDGVTELIATSKRDASRNIIASGFDDLSVFSTFGYGSSPLSYNNVWMFIPKGQNVSSEVFKQTVINTSSDTGKFISSAYRDQVFIGGRLELVSANILATSFREMDESKTKVENGTTTYFYEYKINQEGSLLNPFIISSAEQFESYMTSDGNSTESNGYFRIISDLNYADYAGDISTQRVSLYGIVEGNGMTVKNIDIVGSDVIENAGWIGKVSGSYNSVAAVMNITIVPRVVNFPNANIVGTLTGVVDNANAINIDVLSGFITNALDEVKSVTVSGKNITGGVVGAVKNGSTLKNITSGVGAKAAFIPDNSAIEYGIYSEINGNVSQYSYAGGAVGYVYTSSGRKAIINDVLVKGNDSYIIGNKAGFIFGGLSLNVEVNRAKVIIKPDMLINAYEFGGLIVGESAADLNDIVVVGTKESLRIFSTASYVPYSVGGIVGYMMSGNINKVYMGQSFEIANSQNGTVNYVGGIAGYVSSTYSTGDANISKAIVDATLHARSVLGGVVGYAETNLNLSEIAIYNHSNDPEIATLTVEGELANCYVGGFVGMAAANTKIENSYSLATIKVNTYVYNVAATANVGAIIGFNGLGSTNDVSYVYTITTYNVNIENKKVATTPQKVEYRKNSNDEYVITIGGNENVDGTLTYKQNNLSTIEAGTITGDSQDAKIADARNKNITVFNYMRTVENTELNNETIFTVRIDKVSITLNQNEIGYKIPSYYNAIYGTQQASTEPKIEMYYGLMPGGEDDLWYNSVDANGKYNKPSVLKFESEIKKA